MASRLSALLCSADEAVRLIEDGMTVVSGGFVGAAHPEGLTAAIERRFLSDGHPRDLTLVFAAGQGDGKTRGLNHLGHAGLVKRVIAALGVAAPAGAAGHRQSDRGLLLSAGVICQLLRDIAAGRPGCLTHVGLGRLSIRSIAAGA